MKLHDITQIPFIPWTPGLYEWLVLLVIAATAFLAVYLIWRLRAKRTPIDILKITKLELQRSLEDLAYGHDKLLLQRMGLVTRRLLAVMEDPSISGMTAHELVAFCDKAGIPSALPQVADALMRVEDFTYAPHTDHDVALSAAGRLVRNVSLYIDERRSIVR